MTLYRLMFWLLLVRSLSVCCLTVLVPLITTLGLNEEVFFPIPPNRECIESVDMVLHIPIAVDYFYNYL